MFDNFQLTWLAVIPVLGFLIFVHELGHFLAARWMGVRVLEFGFGYPPRALKLFERGGVEYTLNWLPLGGFVRMAGENDDFDAPDSLANVAPWRRIVVLAAGPFMNILTAVIMFAIIYMAGVPTYQGDATSVPSLITAVSPNSPAEAAGLQPGDVVYAINGVETLGHDNLSAAIRANAGKEMTMLVKRSGEEITVTMTPRLPEEIPNNEGSAGISITAYTEGIPEDQFELVRLNPAEALVAGVQRTGDTIVLMIGGLTQLIRAILPSVSAPEGGVGGVVAIGRITAQVAEQGWRELLSLTAFLSLNLAILNLLPIPALDGGRIVFALVEMVRRKRIPPEKEALVHFAGFALLIAFMVLITVVDVSNWIAGKPALPGG